MRSKFDEQLRILNEEMIRMSTMIEKAIQEAMDALFTQNTSKALQVMEEDELVDREQKKIEHICFQLLIQQQPVARDLRNITAALKMVTDMERIGDHAADISELTILISNTRQQWEVDTIRVMAGETMTMLLRAVEAYVNRDMEMAKEVIAHDDVVDELFLQVKGELIQIMKENTDQEEYAADLLMVNKYLERIGDHATNIAEWVIFSLNDHAENESLGT